MKFQAERKRYLQNPLLGFVIHFVLSALFLASILLSLKTFSWVPLAIYFSILSVGEIVFWHDKLRR